MSDSVENKTLQAAEELTLIVGHVYSSKRPKSIGLFDPLFDDRMIRWMGLDGVQYDSPSVKDGRRLPIVTREKFLKWASRDITAEMPKGEWRSVK